VKVEEDTTWDSETNHTGEGVAYLAIQGDGLLTAEVSGGGTYTETAYYYFDGQRVAMRRDGVLYYIVADHLGTTSAVFDAGGSLHNQSRHYPYGTERWATGTVPTDHRFTGQRLDSCIKLTLMGVRWYDDYLNYFISPDPIIPDPANPQSLNRFAYAMGNPFRYTDPSGHDPLDTEWERAFYREHDGWPDDLDRFYRLYSVAYSGPVSGSRSWTDADWTYLSEHHNEVLHDTSQRSSLADFSAAIGRLSGWYNEREEAKFVSGLALLYAGWPYDPTGANILDVSLPTYKPINFCGGQSDCKMRYFPHHEMAGFFFFYHDNGAENTHHWAGHLLFGYHYGRTLNLIVTMPRELLSLAMVRGTDFQHDVVLGHVAAHQGQMLKKFGHVTVANFHVYVYNKLGKGP
jgi:RHS repeat-associated protein